MKMSSVYSDCLAPRKHPPLALHRGARPFRLPEVIKTCVIPKYMLARRQKVNIQHPAQAIFLLTASINGWFDYFYKRLCVTPKTNHSANPVLPGYFAICDGLLRLATRGISRFAPNNKQPPHWKFSSQQPLAVKAWVDLSVRLCC